MKKPEYLEEKDRWIVYMDDYSNGLLFEDAKSAWKCYYESLASDKSDYEFMAD
jgi:hypothetical protein